MAICPDCGHDVRKDARFCDFCGAPLAAPTEHEIRKTVTVLFADVSGSTALAEKLDAESVRRIMGEYFGTAREAIERHGGTVEKFIGDAVMAVFGLPLAHEDDALRAVRAATEMRDRLALLSGEVEGRFGAAVAFRIGLNTGEVVAGDASVRQALVTGDAVNVAARLEQHAGANQILLGENTYRLVAEAVAVERVDPVAAKGKTEPVPAYLLISVEAPHVRRPHADRPLVGRRDELGLLRSAFEAAVKNRSCRLVTVVGEPGMGKSRLARELMAVAGETARVLEGRCLSYGEGITYWAVAEMLKTAAGIGDEESRESARAKLGDLVAAEEQGALVADLVAQAIGLSEGQAASAPEIDWAIRGFLASLARARPLLVVVDDIQWAEPALLDLLASLAQRIEDAPLLCLCLARPELLEERPDWEPTLELGPLADEDAAALLPAEVAELRDKIIRTASGNPLFIEELASFLTEATDAEALPPSLAALLGARLDLLSGDERAALERASVEGELFHRGAVVALARREVAAELDRLRARDLVRTAQAQFVDESAFRFRHILVRETAYNGTTKALRAELHERFADWLAEKVGARVAEFEEILGYHLEQAHRYLSELGELGAERAALGERAGRRLANAGVRALDRGDVAAAVNLLNRAAALLPADSIERLTLMLRLGNALVEIAEYGRAEAVFAEVVDRSRKLSELRLELRAELELILLEGFTANPEGQGARLVETAREAIPIFEQAGDDDALARAWHLASHDDWAGCRWGRRVEALKSGLVHAERAGDKRSQAELTGWLCTAIMMGPTHAEEGTALCEAFLTRARGQRAVEAHVRNAQAVFSAMQGRFADARGLYRAARKTYAELGLVHWEAGRTVNGALVEILAGDPQAAEREVRWGVETLAAMGERNAFSTVAAFWAVFLIANQRYDEADRAVTMSEDATAPGDVINEILCRRVRGRILAWQGSTEAAEKVARDALQRVEQTDMLNIHADTLLDLAEVLRAAGRESKARVVTERALGLYERKGNVVSAKWARSRIAELAVAR